MQTRERISRISATRLIVVAAVLTMWSGGTAWERSPHPTEARTIPLTSGPGGPILLVTDPARPFSSYLSEILRNEGLGAFRAAAVADLTPTLLASHQLVVLGKSKLNERQVDALERWVQAGGNLIVMQPGPELASLCGLFARDERLSEGYLRVDTSTRLGEGISDEAMQFHGEATLYELREATAVATLHPSPDGLSNAPAVAARALGNEGGEVVSFAFDLAHSIVLTRQGNPKWAGQERDGIPPRRSNDLFFGAATGDSLSDWIDFERLSIPQADEQQRLLANSIIRTNFNRMPLPRFWYFPARHRAIVLMTADHHGCCAKTLERFERYVEQSPPDCSVPDWECVRASAYVYPNEHLESVDEAHWYALGFEIGAHIDTGCADWDPTTLDREFFRPQLDLLGLRLPEIPGQASVRTHCVAWSDWATQARILEAYGIRLDTNYYFWPPAWVQNRPGFFTGSAMPMRFAGLDGSLIDVYQTATQMTDESEQVYPYTAEFLFDLALSDTGYFGVFTANMHMDRSPHPDSDAIVAAALERGIPVVSGRQLVDWLDGRNASAFRDLAWETRTLSFEVVQARGARNLSGMIPVDTGAMALRTLEREGEPISFRMERIKGIDYAVFAAESGNYRARFEDADS